MAASEEQPISVGNLLVIVRNLDARITALEQGGAPDGSVSLDISELGGVISGNNSSSVGGTVRLRFTLTLSVGKQLQPNTEYGLVVVTNSSYWPDSKRTDYGAATLGRVSGDVSVDTDGTVKVTPTGFSYESVKTISVDTSYTI